jgi:multidrug efflux system membrane fusion protein
MNRALLPSLLLVSSLSVSCGDSSSGKAQIALLNQRDITVTAETVKASSFPVLLFQPGMTYAIRDIQLASRVTGYVEQVNFTDGAVVKAGDVLFQIDPRPFEAALLEARGNLEGAVAARNLAARTVERNRPLVESGAVSREQFDTYVTDLEKSEGQVETAAGQLVDAELNLEFSTIRAPFDGRVGQREVELGDLVQASGSPNLVSIVQYHPMRVLLAVDANELPSLSKAFADGPFEASVRVNGSRGGGGKVFQGVVDFIDNHVNKATSTVTVRARFDNPDAWAYPGQYSEATLNLGTVPNSIVIPEAAIRADQGGRYVWVIDSKDTISRRDLTIASTENGSSRITKGLKVGQKIVIDGSDDLVEGDKVTISKASSKSSGSSGSDAGGTSASSPSSKSS